MTGILDGIRVLDLTVFQVGPFATAMLADLGADVIHIEERSGGDILRGLVSKGINPERDGRHVHFEEHNRNKRGLALDLKQPEGREIVYRLAASADVFVTNMRGPAVARLGMDCDSLRQRNSRLIYAQATAFGRRGPDVNAPSVDQIGLARGGMMLASGFEGDPPTPISVGTGDRATAFLLAYGILGALLARERFGIAQEVHTSMLGASLVLHGWSVIAPLLMGGEYPRGKRSASTGRPAGYYQCNDSRWISFQIMTDRAWQQTCRVLGCSELVEDPRFATGGQRSAHAGDLEDLIQDAIQHKSAAEWQAIVRDQGPDLLFTIVNRPADLIEDEHVTLNNYITTWDHPTWGPVDWVGFPVDWSETPATLRRPAPALGEHNEEILLEVGYSWDDIGRLRESSVI
jgi:crotonobetainyl-CoA:carnitine CoA-transferase CaiB-like acyl-CoA transferase